MTIDGPHTPTPGCDECQLLLVDDDRPETITRTRHGTEYSVLERAIPGSALVSSWIRRRTIAPSRPSGRQYHYAGRL
jgi:hypothetical protein